MAQYRVVQKSFINNTIVEEGAIIEFDGEPGANLELVKGKKGAVSSAVPEEEGFPGSTPEQPLV
jgi:hypothetical protein